MSSPVLLTTGAFEVGNKIMLKCPNCDADIKLTWKLYYKNYYNLPCPVCETHSQVVLPVWLKCLEFIIALFAVLIFWIALPFTMSRSSVQPGLIVVSSCMMILLSLAVGAYLNMILDGTYGKLRVIEEENGEKEGRVPDNEDIQPGSPDNWSV
jgi:hypothetical protein